MCEQKRERERGSCIAEQSPPIKVRPVDVFLPLPSLPFIRSFIRSFIHSLIFSVQPSAMSGAASASRRVAALPGAPARLRAMPRATAGSTPRAIHSRSSRRISDPLLASSSSVKQNPFDMRIAQAIVAKNPSLLSMLDSKRAMSTTAANESDDSVSGKSTRLLFVDR